MPIRHRLRLALVLLLAACFPLQGQIGRASVNGTVTDESGAVIPQTSVVATSAETGKQAEVRTNAVGIHVFPSLPLGTYTFTYSHGDFQSVEFQGVELRVGQTLTLNAQMKVVAQTTSVKVKSVALLLDRNSAEMAGLNCLSQPRGQPQGETRGSPLSTGFAARTLGRRSGGHTERGSF